MFSFSYTNILTFTNYYWHWFPYKIGLINRINIVKSNMITCSFIFELLTLLNWAMKPHRIGRKTFTVVVKPNLGCAWFSLVSCEFDFWLATIWAANARGKIFSQKLIWKLHCTRSFVRIIFNFVYFQIRDHRISYLLFCISSSLSLINIVGQL